MILKFESQVVYEPEEVNLYYHHVKVPDEIYQQFKEKGIKRIIFTLNEGEANHGGFIPRGDGTYFLITSKQLLKKNKLNIGDPVTVTIQEDTSKYGMPVCDEMKELLEQDIDGSEAFHNLTDGKIRSLLFHVNKYKSSEKRIEKGVIILEHLKANNGKLDWKMLNEAFKQGLNM